MDQGLEIKRILIILIILLIKKDWKLIIEKKLQIEKEKFVSKNPKIIKDERNQLAKTMEEFLKKQKRKEIHKKFKKRIENQELKTLFTRIHRINNELNKESGNLNPTNYTICSEITRKKEPDPKRNYKNI